MVESSMAEKQAIRQLKIKAGVCARGVKDHQSYKVEKTQLEERIEKMRADGTEEGVIKRYETDLAETIAMLPSLKSKIEEAVDQLEQTIGEAEENGIVTDEFKEKEEWTKAALTIKNANDYLESEGAAGL